MTYAPSRVWRRARTERRRIHVRGRGYREIIVVTLGRWIFDRTSWVKSNVRTNANATVGFKASYLSGVRRREMAVGRLDLARDVFQNADGQAAFPFKVFRRRGSEREVYGPNEGGTVMVGSLSRTEGK